MKPTKNLILLENNYTLKFEEFYFKCSIGKKGLALKKFEGDYKTPKGVFKIGDLFYRKDRVSKPVTKLLSKTIKKQMRWCNDINNSKNYNKLIINKKKFRSEKLHRRDSKYDYLIVINYNIPKRIPGKGSAIFIHLTKNYKPTAGCIALSKKDFLILAKLINKKTRIEIN
tara:strand:- start:708 stop:1217 length:510 start_codon:yes stop_codon:yes gene_type:complete